LVQYNYETGKGLFLLITSDISGIAIGVGSFNLTDVCCAHKQAARMRKKDATSMLHKRHTKLDACRAEGETVIACGSLRWLLHSLDLRPHMRRERTMQQAHGRGGGEGGWVRVCVRGWVGAWEREGVQGRRVWSANMLCVRLLLCAAHSDVCGVQCAVCCVPCTVLYDVPHDVNLVLERCW